MNPKEYHAIGREGMPETWTLSKSLLADFAASPYAWMERYMRNEKREPTPQMEFGSAVDGVVTGHPCHEVLDFADYRSKAAQAERDKVREDGLIPMLPGDVQRLNDCVEAVVMAMRKYGFDKSSTQEAFFMGAKVGGETYKVKCLYDFFGPHGDLKVTGDIENVDKTAEKFKYHWQAALYLDCANVNGHNLADRFPFLFVEDKFPFRFRMLYLDEIDIMRGRQEYQDAMRLWHDCHTKAEYPGKELPEVIGMRRRS